MTYKEFKKQFDKNFCKMTPEDLVKKLKKEGYNFESKDDAIYRSVSFRCARINKIIDVHFKHKPNNEDE